MNAMFGPESEDNDRRMAIAFRDGEAETREHHGQDDLGFHQGKGLADAVAWAGSKWNEMAPGRKGLACKSIGFEFVGIFSP